MITLVEALNFRCFRYLHQPLDSFHLIVGPNGSGKSAFLDVISFLSDLFKHDLETAVNKRTTNFHDLVWGREGGQFEIAIEAQPPQAFLNHFEMPSYKFRYEMVIGIDETGKLAVLNEHGFPIENLEKNVKQSKVKEVAPRGIPQTLLTPNPSITVTKGRSAGYIRDHVQTDTVPKIFERGSKTWDPSKTLLANVKSPGPEWLIDFLTSSVKNIELDVGVMRKASSPGQGYKLDSDGSNLPWVIKDFKKKDKARFNEWVKHLRTAIHDISTILTRTREDDKHCYLMVKYKNGLEVPSWCLSDGTLRLLALTLLAYMPEDKGMAWLWDRAVSGLSLEPDSKGIYLIEEPENGVHPLALETIYQSLSSVYGGQVLVATHSPLFVSFAEPEEILCFSKDENGASQIISGDKHPMLKDWSKRVDLGTMFASGVLD